MSARAEMQNPEVARFGGAGPSQDIKEAAAFIWRAARDQRAGGKVPHE